MRAPLWAPPPTLDIARMLGLFGVTFMHMNLWKSVTGVAGIEAGHAFFIATYAALAVYIAYHALPGWWRRIGLQMACVGAVAGVPGAFLFEPAYHLGVLLLAPACFALAVAMLWTPTPTRVIGWATSGMVVVFALGHFATVLEAVWARKGPIMHPDAITQLGMRQGPWAPAIVPALVLASLALVLLLAWRRGRPD